MSAPVKCLEITVVSCDHLPKMDSFFGKCDAYCVVDFKGRSERTKIIEKQYNPHFDETFSFGIKEGDSEAGEIRFSVYDWNKTGKDDIVGQTLLSQQRVAEIIGQDIGWKSMQTLQILKIDNSSVVKGHDKKDCEVTVVFEIVSANLRQQTQMARANSFASRKTLALPPENPEAAGKRRLQITVLQGKHMPKMDLLGSADPMCMLTFQGQEHKTQPKKNTYEPKWDESFWFLVDDVNGYLSELKVEVLDYNMSSAPDPIGNVRIAAADMRLIARAPVGWQGEGTFDVLEPKNEAEVVRGKDKQNCYVSLRVLVDEGCNGIPPPAPSESAQGPRRVQVTVKSARHLPKKDTFGSIDPYCVVRFNAQQHQTSVIKSTYAPEWEEANTFAISDAGDISVGDLRAVVMDWDRGGKHDEVGSVVITEDVMASVVRTDIGWEGHGWFDVVDSNQKVVIGNDKEGSMLCLQLRLLDGFRGIKPPQTLQETVEGPRRMQVCVVSARHLPKMDNSLLGGGTCDPYVVASLAGQQHKTSVKSGYSPDWGENLTFPIQDAAQLAQDLVLQLMEWNRLSAHETVGAFSVAGAELTQMLQADLGWEGEGTYDVMSAEGKPVIGNDGKQCEVTVKIRIMPAQGPLAPPEPSGKVVSGQRSIQLTVVSGRHFPRMDGLTGSCDPFCVVRFADQEHKTSTKKNTYSPDWEESMWFVVDDVADDAGELELVVMDWDRMGKNDTVGTFVVPAETMSRVMRADIGWEGEGTYNLIRPDEKKEVVIGNDKEEATVVVCVTLLDGGRGLNPPQPAEGEEGARRIEITVVSARNLPKMDVLGSCDAYVVVSSGGDAKTSSIKKGTYSPEWEERFIFYVDDVSKPAQEMKLRVLDWDMAGSHDEVGEVVIPAQVMTRVHKAGAGWEGEGTYEIWDPTSQKPVRGVDDERSLLKVRARVLGALTGLDAAQAVEGAEGNRRLEIVVVSVQHLPRMDTFGSCDPFVVVSLGKQEQQTSVKKGVYSATWADEVLPMYVIDVSKPAASDLLVSVMDWDRMGDNDEVGQVVVDAKTVEQVCRSEVGWEGEVTFDVKKEGTGKDVVGRDNKKCTITMRLRVMGEPQLAPPEDAEVSSDPKLLEISVLALRHLPKTDVVGSCDAYCVVHFEGQEFTTSTKKATYSPDWLDESFVFHVHSAEGTAQDLTCMVFDWDQLGAHDKVGDVLIPGSVMTKAANAPGGWQGEGTYYVCSKEGDVVTGKDKEACCMRVRVAVVGGGGAVKKENMGDRSVPVHRQAGKAMGKIPLKGLDPPTEEEIALLNRSTWGWPRVLTVSIVKAWSLPRVRVTECNPCCTVVFEGEEVQTAVVPDSTSPAWADQLRFVVGGEPSDVGELSVVLQDMDLNNEEDVGIDIGEVIVAQDILARVMAAPDGWEGEGSYAIGLTTSKEEDDNGQDDCGLTLRVTVRDAIRGIEPPSEVLGADRHLRMWIKVTVLSAFNVPADTSEEEQQAGTDRSSYCSVAFAGQKRRSTTVHGTTNPAWGDSFCLLAEVFEEDPGPLCLAVVAWNRFGFHEEIGEVVLPGAFMQRVVMHGAGWAGVADATVFNSGQVIVGTSDDGEETECELRFGVEGTCADIPDDVLQRARDAFLELDSLDCGFVDKDRVNLWLRDVLDWDPSKCFEVWDGPWYYYSEEGLPFAGFLAHGIESGWFEPRDRHDSMDSSVEFDPWDQRQAKLFGGPVPRWRRLQTRPPNASQRRARQRDASGSSLPSPDLVHDPLLDGDGGDSSLCKRGAQVVLLDEYASRHGLRPLRGLVGILSQRVALGKWKVMFPKVETERVVHTGACGQYGLVFAATVPGLQWELDDATKRWERERHAIGFELGPRKQISTGLEPYAKIKRGSWGIAGGAQQTATAGPRGGRRQGRFGWS